MMRLDKFFSETTSYSRADARKKIRSGSVSVNGSVVRNPETKVNEAVDRIELDFQAIFYRKYVYLMLNKPQGYVSATEDRHDPVVIDLVPEDLRHYHVFPVGRLDKDTEGLLLLTNDGQFDHALMSPRREVRKRYYALLDRPAEEADIQLFAAGMEFQDFTSAPALLEIDPEDPKKVCIEISEGKYHQVKRMCERVGKKVVFLKREAIGSLRLDERLAPGEMRELTEDEFHRLMD